MFITQSQATIRLGEGTRGNEAAEISPAALVGQGALEQGMSLTNQARCSIRLAEGTRGTESGGISVATLVGQGALRQELGIQAGMGM